MYTTTENCTEFVQLCSIKPVVVMKTLVVQENYFNKFRDNFGEVASRFV